MTTDNKQLERDIENAFRARGLKEAMQQWKTERKATLPTEQKITTWRKIRRTIYSLSIAAALVGIVAMAIPASIWRTGFYRAYRWGYQQYAHYFLKPQGKPTKTPTEQVAVLEEPVNEFMAMASPSVVQIVNDRNEKEILGHEDLVQDAAWQIQKGNYAVALVILEDARQSLSEDDAHYQATVDDIEYLEALCHLGQNHYTKAKQLLAAIAESNSLHRETAAKLAAEIE